ncbi:MAG: trimeric intracellular cation channel family protein [Gammaproteobacteria bacterium]|nr:trimeric intracellular cation channel family protein [Gammaproteobacteria bacterium]MBU1647197.1 trimeric intracellular cation channel family protein [Gammaproteobacteria bacterium]MBU1972709.1 trimeric intracellular cation channel family protein [Gammaproteobacteria bacterium]
MPALAVLPTVSDFIYGVGIAAVAVAAITGVLEAGRKGMDLVGVAVVALATALGGGTLRDLLLDRPVFWIANQAYLLTALAAALATFFLVRAVKLPPRIFLVPDALGLALFTVAGTQIALDWNTSWLVASLMGVITGAFGGVLRDVFCNEIPLVFLPGELYVSAAWAGALALVGLQALGLEQVAAGWIAMAVIVALRLAGMRYKMRLPTFSARE